MKNNTLYVVVPSEDGSLFVPVTAPNNLEPFVISVDNENANTPTKTIAIITNEIILLSFFN